MTGKLLFNSLIIHLSVQVEFNDQPPGTSPELHLLLQWIQVPCKRRAQKYPFNIHSCGCSRDTSGRTAVKPRPQAVDTVCGGYQGPSEHRIRKNSRDGSSKGGFLFSVFVFWRNRVLSCIQKKQMSINGRESKGRTVI